MAEEGARIEISELTGETPAAEQTGTAQADADRLALEAEDLMLRNDAGRTKRQDTLRSAHALVNTPDALAQARDKRISKLAAAHPNAKRAQLERIDDEQQAAILRDHLANLPGPLKLTDRQRADMQEMKLRMQEVRSPGEPNRGNSSPIKMNPPFRPDEA